MPIYITIYLYHSKLKFLKQFRKKHIAKQLNFFIQQYKIVLKNNNQTSPLFF